MKRMLARLVAIWMCLAFALPALAEEEAMQTREQTVSEFVFRNGITWDCTMEEVIASEEGEGIILLGDGFTSVEYKNASMSNYSGRLIYGFIDGRLKMIMYYFNPEDLDDRYYIFKALTSKYGESSISAMTHIWDTIEMLLNREEIPTEWKEKYFDKYDEKQFAFHRPPTFAWVLEDGTAIHYFSTAVETYWGDFWGSGYIMYIDGSDTPKPLEDDIEYNTDGL